MEKKVSGVMLDTSLAKEDDEVKEFEEELAKAESKPKQSNIFIPDEDEFHDDIHEITLKNEEYEVKTDVESDGQHVFREEEFVPEKDYENFASENRFREREPERPKEKPYERSVPEPKLHGMGYDDVPQESEEEMDEIIYDDPMEDAREAVSEIQAATIEPEPQKGSKLVARATDEFKDDHVDDPLPDVPVHAEHIGNGMNGDYVIHAQDHISRSRGADNKINGSKPSSADLGPGPHTTSPGMEKEIEKHKMDIPKKYVFPPIDLLEKGVRNKNTDSARQLKETAVKLQEILATFGVNVTVTDISQGPAVTRFELQPEAGVRVNKIVNLADDIKMNLAASDIRIEAPIPGKAAVGIEVPNKENQAVALRDLLESEEYKEFPSNLAFAVGKDIGGKTVVTDIAKMPHLLIAGATGSGKSVCINTIIMSLIYKAKPEDVQMIMIDPKIVELSVYNGIPHLMIPVVTDPKKAAAALNWAVAEMTNRYKKFADCGVRDLKGYNKMAKDSNDPNMNVLPQLVVIVDELADLMMVSANEVEDAICRLTQLARAAGIHLIIATQRPSVDVITGLIKANMPSRIAFAVSSGVDSRTILDINGAEKLLGKGDMLFYPQGYTKPARVQGAFVSDKEVQAVTDFLKNQKVDSSYGEEIEKQIQSMQSSSGGGTGGSSGDGSGRDEYFVQAGNIIIEKEKASIGMLQRVFKIGFNRAARIMDQLCEAGVVGDEEGTKPRKVLMTKQEFEAYVNETES